MYSCSFYPHFQVRHYQKVFSWKHVWSKIGMGFHKYFDPIVYRVQTTRAPYWFRTLIMTFKTCLTSYKDVFPTCVVRVRFPISINTANLKGPSIKYVSTFLSKFYLPLVSKFFLVSKFLKNLTPIPTSLVPPLPSILSTLFMDSPPNALTYTSVYTLCTTPLQMASSTLFDCLPLENIKVRLC